MSDEEIIEVTLARTRPPWWVWTLLAGQFVMIALLIFGTT